MNMTIKEMSNFDRVQASDVLRETNPNDVLRETNPAINSLVKFDGL